MMASAATTTSGSGGASTSAPTPTIVESAAIQALGTSTAALSIASEKKDQATPSSPERPGCKRQRDGDEATSSKRQPPPGTRRGKWSAEEEAFAARLIRDFDAGLLDLENGATLRAFLSKKLNCSAMRISKKFAGDKCLGKQIFLRRSGVDDEQLDKEKQLLAKLEAAFVVSITGGEQPAKTTSPKHAPPAVVSRPVSSAEASSASEDEAPPKAATTTTKQQQGGHHGHHHHHHHKTTSRDVVDVRKCSPLTMAKLGPRLPSVETTIVEPNDRPKPPKPSPSVDDELLDHLERPAAYNHRFRELGHGSEYDEINPEARQLAEELVEAHRRANQHKSSSFADLPKADCIQSPPAALMLELGPTPRRLPHPTIGAYAFSIARGTSNSSLHNLADQDPVTSPQDQDPLQFFDDAVDLEDDHLAAMDLDGHSDFLVGPDHDDALPTSPTPVPCDLVL